MGRGCSSCLGLSVLKEFTCSRNQQGKEKEMVFHPRCQAEVVALEHIVSEHLGACPGVWLA